MINTNKELVPVRSINNKSLNEILQSENLVEPAIDIYENDNEFVLTANMPGLLREDLRVTIEDNELILFGKVDYENLSNRKYILNENPVGNYYRKFRISDSINSEQTKAKYDNGQLIVIMTKSEKARSRKIEII